MPCLTTEQKDFIKRPYFLGDYYIQLGWLSDLINQLSPSTWSDKGFVPTPNTRSSVIADIHTDPNTKRILEVGTGYMEHIIVKLKGWNGTEILAVGPVFSYYEFILPMDLRMTDDLWRGILITSQNETLRNDQDLNAFGRGFWAQSYMVSREMTTSTIYWEVDNISPPEWFKDIALDCEGTAMAVERQSAVQWPKRGSNRNGFKDAATPTMRPSESSNGSSRGP